MSEPVTDPQYFIHEFRVYTQPGGRWLAVHRGDPSLTAEARTWPELDRQCFALRVARTWGDR